MFLENYFSIVVFAVINLRFVANLRLNCQCFIIFLPKILSHKLINLMYLL